MHKPNRSKHPHRLGGWNYADPGWYFITICTVDRILFFGDVEEGRIRLSDIGEIVEACWREIPSHFQKISLDEFIVMPNHIHGIMQVIDVPDPHITHRRQTARRRDQTGRGTVSAAIGGFKSVVTKRIIKQEGGCEGSVWQSNFYDRIIRSPSDLARVRQYIRDNPKNWDEDDLNPHG